MGNLPKNKNLSINQAAKYLGVSTKTLRRWDASGVISSLRTKGGHRRYGLLDLQLMKNIKKGARKNKISRRDILQTSEKKVIPQEEKKIDKVIAYSNLYESFKLHPDQKRAVKFISSCFSLMVIAFLFSKIVGADTNIIGSYKTGVLGSLKQNLANLDGVPLLAKPLLNSYQVNNINSELTAEQPTQKGSVLATAGSSPLFNVYIQSSFNEIADFVKGLTSTDVSTGTLETTGAAALGGTLNVTGATTLSSLTTTGDATFGNITRVNGVTYSFPTIQGSASTYLKNNGSGTLTWATVSVPSALTDLSGVLPIANGGTNNSSSYTAGSVIFSDGTKLTQDNSNLFWDNTNDRLGIDNSAPAAALSVGTSNQFLVNSTGNITKINGVTYSFPSSQGAASSMLTNDGAGGLTWSTSGSGITGNGVSGQVSFFNGTSSITGSTSFTWNDTTKILSTTGLSLTLGSDATGDTYYRDGSGNFTRLGIGSTGQVLTVSGGLPVWTGGSGTGSSGFWTRTATTLSPYNAGDNIATSGKIGIGSASAPTYQLDLNANTTTGTVFNLAYPVLTALTGDLTGSLFDLDSGNVTATDQNVTGLQVKLPTVTNTITTGTKYLRGFYVSFGSGAGINQTGAGGTTTYNALDVNLPALTQTAGTLNVNGLYINSPSSITTGGTASGIYVNATGVAAGSLYGLNITGITASTGTETALNIGSGWDNVLTVNSIPIINGSGITQMAGGGTGFNTYTKGDVIYSDAANSLAKLGIGSTGYVLTVSAGGVPTWNTISGSSCTNCLINNPTSDQTISPTNDTTGLSIRQTTAVSPTHDIFSVTNSTGLTKYLYVDSNGVVNIPSIGSSASDQLTITPGTDKFALKLVGTNVATNSLQIINSGNTSGTIFDINYAAVKTLTGALTGINLDLATNLTVTNQSVTGQKITTPTWTNTNAAGTNNYYGLQIAPPVAGGINQNGAGASVYYGLDITSPALTQTAGTLTSYGINLTTPSSITTGGTAYGIKINSTGVGAGSLYGLNIGNITGSTGAETALYVGTGWDYAAYFAGGNVNIQGLSVSSAVYTDASKNLTSTAPTSGAIGYWSRTGTTLSPTTATDNINLTPNLTTEIGTGAGLYLAANSLTSGRAVEISSSSLTAGNLMTLISTSTAGNEAKLLRITSSGANGTAGVTNYGQYTTITNTGTTSTNVAGFFTATGATINYGLTVAAMTGATSYGLNIGELTGATANFGININSITAAATASNYGININQITTQAGSTAYGINTGGFAAAGGTTTVGINLGANASTAATNYGIRVGAISGAGTNNYGLYVDTVSGASNNYAGIFAGGKVGIGTTTPLSTLQVGAASAITNLSDTFIVRGSTLGGTAGNYIYPAEIQDISGNLLRLQIAGYRRATSATWIGTAYRLQYGVDSSFTDGSKAFIEIGGDDPNSSGGGFISLGTAGSDRLSVINSGYVGIGTTAPTTPLYVRSPGASVSEVALTLDNPNATAYSTTRMNLTANGAIRSSIGSYQDNTGLGGFLSLETYDSTGTWHQQMTIDPSGKVGIGNTSPVGKLDVSGAVVGKALAMFNETGDQAMLTASASGVTKFTVDHGGSILANTTTTATTGTTEAVARNNVTTVTLTAAGSFANNDIIYIDNAGTDYMTRIVSGGGTTTLTVSPAVSYDVSAGVTKYNSSSIGATLTDYTTLANRYFQGYFTGGIVTGTTSTTYSDNNIAFGGGSKLLDKAGKLQLQAGGTGTGSTGTGSIYFLDSSGNTRGRVDTTTPTIDASFGNGADGDVTISTAGTNINTTVIKSGRAYADGIAYRVTAPASGTNTVTAYSGSVNLSNGIAPGDEVLLINLQGATGDTAAVGTYEFLRVKYVAPQSITFTTNTANSYTGSSAANQKVVIQRVPNYGSVTLSGSGTLTASGWDILATTPTGTAGYYTGIVAFRSNGTVTVASGTSITTTGLGYNGGAGGAAGAFGGSSGESFDGTVGRGGNGASGGETNGGGKAGDETTAAPTDATTRGGGGGGGSSGSGGAFTGNYGGGGGGGSYGGGGGGAGAGGGGGGGSGGNGGAGGDTAVVAGGGGGSSNGSANGGAGGAANANGANGNLGGGGAKGVTTGTGNGGGGGNTANGAGGAGGGGGGYYGSATLPTMFYGSGGGGGGGTTNNPGNAAGKTGADGGGIIFIAASTITVTSTGTITSTGSTGTASANNEGGSGSGAGGSIYIAAGTSTLGTSLVTASGGSVPTHYNGGAGGGGGVGRIRVETTGSASGTTTPTASTAVTISSGVQSQTDISTAYGTLYMGSINSASADLAEYYVSGDKSISAGDVVSVSNTKLLDNNEHEIVNQGVLRKSEKAYDSRIIGIISTNPGVTLGSIDGSTNQADSRQLALSGRVPVKIDPDSDPILIGDFLTSSEKPGYAKKATKAGYTVAKALESWNKDSGKDRIESFVNLGFYMGGLTADGYFDTQNSFIASDVQVGVSQDIYTKLFSDSSIINSSTTATDSAAATDSATVATASANVSISQAIAKIVERMDKLEQDDLILKSQILIASGSGQTATDAARLNSLTVLGNSLLGDTIINGKLSIGGLTLDSATQSVNAIGILKIQDLGLGNVEFMNGLVTVDTQGNVIVKSITSEKYKVAGAAAGAGKIPAGQTSVIIDSDQVTDKSLIFVTSKNVTNTPLSVTQKTIGVSFKVEIPSSVGSDVDFDWVIVDKE